jgi:CYTH domain-containing protein
MKYAVVERERRFLPSSQVDLSGAARVLQIDDSYLIGTRLRLRTVHEPGRAVVHKLGQKVRFAAAQPFSLAHTTVYLDEAEYALLSEHPAATLSKTRHVLSQPDQHDVAVDVFHGDLSGLTLAEIDLGADGTLSEPLPSWLGVEVTDVEEFTGRALADLTHRQLADVLDRYRS